MKTNGNDKALEAYKIFPFVAWGLVIGFTYFVYGIAVELQAVATDLKIQTEYLQQQVNTPVGSIESFER
ncbi:hypothetical protein KC926_03800 [Candidatus Kaiserbacteria bacterium]|nr:hypothetical protein [Candidatus Kaiserbacteria bacterium]